MKQSAERGKDSRQYKPTVLSVIFGNVRSFPNKMEELMELTRLQWEHREWSLICFTWLEELTPDSLETLES